jgi:hypothetical protein
MAEGEGFEPLALLRCQHGLRPFAARRSTTFRSSGL